MCMDNNMALVCLLSKEKSAQTVPRQADPSDYLCVRGDKLHQVGTLYSMEICPRGTSYSGVLCLADTLIRSNVSNREAIYCGDTLIKPV